MGRNREFDQDALHRLLWGRTDRRGTIKFVQRDLALEVGCSYAHFCRIVAQMGEDGRLEQLSTGFQKVHTYRIVEPQVWIKQRLKEMAETGW